MLCRSVSVSGMERCVARLLFPECNFVSLGYCFWNVTLSRSVSVSGM